MAEPRAYRCVFIRGSVAVAIAWTLTGCVFGNHIIPATNPDTISGYYSTQAQTLKFFTTVNGQDASADAPVTQIPSSVSAILTNPLWVQLQDPSTGAAQMSSPSDPSQYLAVDFQSDNQTFGINGSYNPATLWTNPGCTIQEYIEVTGRIEPPGDAPSSMAFLGTSYEIAGQVSMDVWIEQRISGNCAWSLQAVSACYQDVSQCGGATSQDNQASQEYVQQLFSPYVQAGILTAQDIQTVSDIAFQISYQ